LRLLAEFTSDPAVFDAEVAESYFNPSRALAEELHMRPLLAQCTLGLVHQRTNRRGQAQAHLRVAAALFEQMGMKPPPGASV
jgi:hypothetical protein